MVKRNTRTSPGVVFQGKEPPTAIVWISRREDLRLFLRV
jgi:hypothetical protein